jgi:hypothetical protein
VLASGTDTDTAAVPLGSRPGVVEPTPGVKSAAPQCQT